MAFGDYKIYTCIFEAYVVFHGYFGWCLGSSLWFLIWSGLSFHFNVFELNLCFLIIFFMVTSHGKDFIQGHIIWQFELTTVPSD